MAADFQNRNLNFRIGQASHVAGTGVDEGSRCGASQPSLTFLCNCCKELSESDTRAGSYIKVRAVVSYVQASNVLALHMRDLQQDVSSPVSEHVQILEMLGPVLSICGLLGCAWFLSCVRAWNSFKLQAAISWSSMPWMLVRFMRRGSRYSCGR